MSARKIGLLLLLLAFGGAIEAAWNLRGDLRIGPEGCRVMGGRFYGPSYTFEQAGERALPGPSARVEVRNAFGEVRVSAGQAGVVKARLRKVVFQPTEERARAFADRIELVFSGEGSLLRVGTNREAIDHDREVGFETHLEIEVPPDSTLSVRNEHGRVDLSGVAGAELVSSFDGVNVESISRDLTIESRHGDVSVERVDGRLELSSRHGNVSLKQVRGGGKLDVQHGELTTVGTGALQIALQHGQLHTSAVDGDLLVRAGHSDLDVSDVVGRADLETSFAQARLLRIGGSGRVRVDHGHVSAEDVSGGLSVETSYDTVQLERVSGPVEATVHHGGVLAKGLAQGARVRASGADVTLEGVSGPVEVEVERGNVRVSPRAPIVAPLVVSVAQGEAQIDVPAGSRIDLEAESRRGELHASVPGLDHAREGRSDDGRPGQRLAARLGGGGPAVRVHADGDIRLEARPVEAIAERDVAKPDLAGWTGVAGAPGVSSSTPTTLAPPAEKPPDAPGGTTGGRKP